jgi:DNA-binding NarL/FixJ family response regulator
MTEATIRVGVADDHTLFREGLRALFESLPGLDLVGTATDCEDAVRLAVIERPDVLLMDIRMPGGNGIATTARIGKLAPEVAVVMLTMVEERESIAEAVRHGARGYVLKGADEDELVSVVRSVAAGGMHFGPSVADEARTLLRSAGAPYAAPLPALGERERAILDLLASGYDVPRIAAALSLSVKSVRNYLTGIPRRLGVPDREAAVRVAREAGLGRH